MKSWTEHEVLSLAGKPVSLAQYSGSVVLIVNTASECGFTPQYEALEALYRRYKHEGFVVLGFPSNDFGGQEPGTAEQIGAFCTSRFAVSFPLFKKVTVVGPEQHPLFAELVAQSPETTEDGPDLRNGLAEFARSHNLPEPNPAPEILWNFEKFLIGRDGAVVGRFASSVKPDDPRLIAAVESALEK